MRLGEILNKIFRKRSQSDVDDREMAEDIYKPINTHRSDEESRFKEVEKHILTEQSRGKKTWQEKVRFKNMNISIVVVVLVVSILVALFSVLFMRLANSSFKEGDVVVTIVGPTEISVGDKITYEIMIENKNRTRLNDVVLQMKLPDNFILQDVPFVVDRNLSGAKIVVGELRGHSKKRYKINMIVGYADAQKMSLKAIVRYQPDTVASYFQASSLKSIKLKKIDLDIFVMTAETVSNGEMLTTDVIIKNNSENDFGGAILKIEYPDGFIYESSSEKTLADKNNAWVINDLGAGSQYKITIKGRLEGQLDAIKKFKVFLLKDQNDQTILTKTEKTLKIVPSKVLLKQVVDVQNVSPGDYLQYKVLFKNNGTTPLRNLVLKSYLPGKYIDRNNVDTKYGYYDSRENVITWKAADVNQLALLEPGEEGSVMFRVKVQDKILPKNKLDKNYYTIAQASIESLDIDSSIFENKRIVSNKIKTLINSVTNIVTKASYFSDGVDVAEGDNVLKVNKETLIKIEFDIYNTSNRLKDVRLTANLPSGVKWKRQILPEGDNLKFDVSSSKLDWQLGTVEVDTGFLSPPEKAVFIVSVTPSANQINHGIDLIKDIVLVAQDTFTNRRVGFELAAIASEAVNNLKLGVVQK